MHFALASALGVAALVGSVSGQYTATYTPDTVPKSTEDGQLGVNQCGTENSQDSMCQNAYINSIDDFCLWAPPHSDGNINGSAIGFNEAIEVAWCTKKGYGTRLIPDNTLTGVHFVKTPKYVQITGLGKLTNLGIPDQDGGGELDPHGATGKGNPVGGLVFSTAFTGKPVQIHEWTNFMAFDSFCFRACLDAPDSATYCQHIYDVMGCYWNMPGNYGDGVFESCDGDATDPMGVYTDATGKSSTFWQGFKNTPSAHIAAPSSNCKTISTIANGQKAGTFGTNTGGATAAPTTSGAASGKPKGTTSGAASTGTGSGSGNAGAVVRSSYGLVVGLIATVLALSAGVVAVAL